MEAEGGTAEGPAGCPFQSLSMESWNLWEGSTEKREWEKIEFAEGNRDGERRRSGTVFREKENGIKEGHHIKQS